MPPVVLDVARDVVCTFRGRALLNKGYKLGIRDLSFQMAG